MKNEQNPCIRMPNKWEVVFDGFPHISAGKVTLFSLGSKISIFPGDHGEIEPQQIVVEVEAVSRDPRLAALVRQVIGDDDAISFELFAPDPEDTDYVIYFQKDEEDI